jgi:hypothetical protein
MRKEVGTLKAQNISALNSLSNEYLGEIKIPEDDLDFYIDIPSHQQWKDNHIRSGWVEIDGDTFRSPKKTVISVIPKGVNYNTHSYSFFQAKTLSLLSNKRSIQYWKIQLDFIEKTLHHSSMNILKKVGITYNEAVFILMGFNVNLLNSTKYPYFLEMSLLNRRPYFNVEAEYLENWLITHATEVIELSGAIELQANTMSTDSFTIWAKGCGFIYEIGERKLQNIDEKLHALLLQYKLINTCRIEELWQWASSSTDELLRYFIAELKFKILGGDDNTFSLIRPYIKQKGKANIEKKGYTFDYKPKNYKTIDLIIQNLIEK